MTAGLPLLSVYLVDFIGSSLMIVLAVVAIYLTGRLRRLEPKKVLWSYFFWLCMALAAFAVSRSTGHILKYVLIFFGYPHVWKELAPYSGGLNTIVFVIIGLLTFYYSNIHEIIEMFREEARELASANIRLKEAHATARQINLSVEQRVEKRARELMKAEQKFHELFDTSKDPIFFCDAQGKITSINDSGLTLLDCEKECILGRSIADFFAEEKQWNDYYQTLFSQGFVKDFEVTMERPDGSDVGMIISSTIIRDDIGEIKGFHGIAKDLIQFKQIPQERIKREKKASSAQLAAEVVHELGNPLELIAGYTKVLEKDCREQKNVHKVLRTIEKQTKNCQKTVAELLKLWRRSADMVAVDINHCLEEALTDMEQILNLDRIYVIRKKDPHLRKVRGYPEKLRKVFVNIINYERQTLQMDDTIGVWTGYHKDTGEIEIIIADTGPLIPSEVAENIFDPFFFTRKMEKETDPAGLGLSVSVGIIKAHQGHIELESTPGDPELVEAGMNTAFRIRLPALEQKSLGGADSGDR